jgi:branched-subunit amino acid aminotransferase/4-amino-4-deoxychorismate lyase
MENNISVAENNISKEDLLNSEEIFLTNAVKGIQSISLLDGKSFASIRAQEFTKLLNQSLVLD